MLLLQPQARIVSSVSEHEESVHLPQLRTVRLGPGIMGMHVVSPVAGAVSLNHFRDGSLLLMGFGFSKTLWQLLSSGIKKLVKEFLLS